MSKKLIPIIILLLIGIIIFHIFSDKPEMFIEKNFVVEKGQGVNEISRNLKKAGVITNKLKFEIYLWLKDLEGKIQAGEYELKTEMKLKELVNVLTSGEGFSQEQEIKIIEGWTSKEIANYLEKEWTASKSNFLKAITTTEIYRQKYTFLPRSVNLEGYLFPDTYRIYKSANAEDIIEKMLANFDQKLTVKMRDDIKNQSNTLRRNQGETIFEIITLASILEKEVAKEEDRKLVADIFYKRLKVGMPLQADSTINFITGKKTTRASKEDLQTDSPYNTYKYRGLPPGPISNPGLSAIKAAIYPEKNDYWYFLTTKDGKTIFSKTNDEHNENKAKYLK